MKMKINLCLVFALLLVLLVSYSLAVENSEKATDKVEPTGGDGGGGNWGGGGGGHWGGGGGCQHGCCNQGHHGCQQCCHSPEEAKAYAEKQTKVEPAGGGGGGNWGGGGGGGGCHYGCCGRGPYGCQRCCHSLEEAKAFVEKQTKVEPAGGGGGGNWGGGGGGGHWGGGGGGGCHYGCCGRGPYGCQRCCHSLEEAKAFVEKQTKVEPAGGGGGGNWGGGGGGGHWGGGGGGGCHYGCCGRGPYGCQRCCNSLEEAKAVMEKQATAHP